MSLNTNNTQEPQVNNGGVNNNQNPMNAALGGNAGKGCFGLGKLGCAGIAILAALAMWVYSGYNGLVTQEEEVKTAWSQVENQYQRRIDLIKNVAASAKKYANTEKEIQLGTANARAHNNTAANADQQMQAVAATADSLANVKMDPNDAKSMQSYAAAQDKMLEQARLAINVVHEAYPELKSDKLFENFKDGVPLGLLSQFMPIQYTRVREGRLKNDPKELVMDRVGDCIDEYQFGSHQWELVG